MEYEILPINPAMLELIEHQGEDAGLQAFTREILLLEVYLATHYDPALEPTVSALKADTALQLLRTPSGDEFAVTAYYEGVPVGTLPIQNNAIIARLMDAGKVLTCRVADARIDHEFMTNRIRFRVRVKIYLVD